MNDFAVEVMPSPLAVGDSTEPVLLPLSASEHALLSVDPACDRSPPATLSPYEKQRVGDSFNVELDEVVVRGCSTCALMIGEPEEPCSRLSEDWRPV